MPLLLCLSWNKLVTQGRLSKFNHKLFFQSLAIIQFSGNLKHMEDSVNNCRTNSQNYQKVLIWLTSAFFNTTYEGFLSIFFFLARNLYFTGVGVINYISFYIPMTPGSDFFQGLSSGMLYHLQGSLWKAQHSLIPSHCLLII